MTAALPAGRGETRTRLYDGSFGLVFDTATSDMHPDDYLRTSGYLELNAVVDYPDGFRWSGKWCRTSRRKIARYDSREYLKYVTWPDNPLLAEYFAPPPSSPYTIVDMYGRGSTPARWAPITEPPPFQFPRVPLEDLGDESTPAGRLQRMLRDVVAKLTEIGAI